MKLRKHSCRGGTSVLAVFFVALFATLSLSFTAITNVNMHMSHNHHDMTASQAAAESGLQYALYLIKCYDPPAEAYSPSNNVSETDAEETFGYFATHVEDLLDPSNVSWDMVNNTLIVPANGMMPLTAGATSGFSLLFSFEPGVGDEPHYINVTSTGNSCTVDRKAGLSFRITKDNRVLEFAVASRSRVIITGDSTIEGDIFSTWDKPEIAPPFSMENISKVNGTLNTVTSEDEYGTGDVDYTLDEVVLGEHEGICYDQTMPDMPGMSVDDYDTGAYYSMTSSIPASGTTRTEYFPHQPGNYSSPSGSARKLYRQVYQNQTFTNARLPANRNALFVNCTFGGILYVEGNTNSRYNNVRFDNCNFNGAIVTEVANNFLWQNNVLYFTGGAIFNNTYMEEATILAPNFNVNLGNTQELVQGESVLQGAIVGGIVDVRGNATIEGTILSMYDPTPLGAGAGAYGTNVGFSDENNEAGIPEDIGTITITPRPDRMLPSGMRTPIIIIAEGDSYVEY